METEVFERFRDIIYTRCGIVLAPEKKSLLEGRIQRRLRAHGIESERKYLEIIELDVSGDELTNLIDAISTNTTHFWREPEHFEVLGDIFDLYRQERRSKVRIWCAASSSGQEPYILAMEALEHLSADCDVKILATDISTKILNAAVKGCYSEDDVSRLPMEKRARYLQQIRNEEDGDLVWQISPQVASLVTFKKLNLISYPYPLKGPLDVIFCRNVMIYFDVPTRQQIIDEQFRLLAPGGYLFLSLSESLLGITHNLEKVSTSVYRKPA